APHATVRIPSPSTSALSAIRSASSCPNFADLRSGGPPWTRKTTLGLTRKRFEFTPRSTRRSQQLVERTAAHPGARLASTGTGLSLLFGGLANILEGPVLLLS